MGSSVWGFLSFLLNTMKTIIHHALGDTWKEGWPTREQIFVDVSSSPDTGAIVISILCPDFSKEKVFFLATHHPVLPGTPTANAIMYRLCSIRRRTKRVWEFVNSLTHDQCLEFLGYKEKHKKKGKK